MGKELAQQSADAGREPGGTAEAIAARGGDPAIAAFIGGGGSDGSDSLNSAMPAGAAVQPSSSPAPDADCAARPDAEAAGADVSGADRASAPSLDTLGILPEPS